MDISEEPQRKVFKARKTMKASDRQQLEAVHKAKEELLKPAELKLINGNHENGDSDMNFVHNTDSLGDRNDVIDAKCEDTPIVEVNLSALKDDLGNFDLVNDLKLPLEKNPSDHIPSQDASNDETGADALLVSSICSDPQLDSAFGTNDQKVSEELSLLESLSSDADFSEHSQSNIPVEGKSLCVMKELDELDNLNLVDNKERKLECEPIVPCLDIPNDIDEVSELHNLDTLDNMEKHDCSDENDQKKIEKEISSDEIQDTEEGQESVKKEENVECLDKQKTDLLPDMDVVDLNTSLRENVESEALNAQAQQDVGEEAISSSMEVDQPLKTVEQSSSLILDLSSDKTGQDVQPGAAVENVNSMETDEIIPILEKLAPVEDVLQCFSKSPLHSESVPEKVVESIAGTPSKNASESLPSEAFLVLSDEEETCENLTKETSSIDDKVTKEAPEAEVQQNRENACDVEADKSEIFHRKRSKSEDLDSRISKRRRFEREEYEAELKVKITAGDDLNKKLQKVIQRMFEEKLSALQCADFDKAVAELKTRVEKIECKKHEIVLHSIQAKITRLTKRFGTAKEDLKRRPEQTTVTQPVSPAKPAVTDFTAVSNSNSNSTIYRNGSTVRQMLESKRNVGETTTAHLQTLTSVPSSVPNPTNITVRASNATQISSSQPPTNGTIQTRAPPDWKLIQQKINAQNTQSTQPKSNPPVTSAPAIPSVISAATTATVVGNSQVSTSTSQPMSVSLQSLPVILHVPLAVPSQSQIIQGTTGTLVTNQQSGNVEFIPVQNQSSVSNLPKTPVTLPVTKAINSSSMPSSSIQRNSPASSVPSTLTVQAISANHPITLSSRPSVPTVGSSSIYNPTSNRSTAQLKSSVSGYTVSSEPSPGSRAGYPTDV